MKKHFLFISCLALTTIIYSCGEATVETEKPTETVSEQPAADKTAAPKTIIDLNSIAGKSAADVEKVLGKAESTDKAKPSGTPCEDSPCDKSSYQSGKYEIVFINGKADWITINNLSDYTLDVNAVELLGLPSTSPVFDNPTSVIRWEGVNDIAKISFFSNGAGKISYADIKVATE
jgi:hypothetical protein